MNKLLQPLPPELRFSGAELLRTRRLRLRGLTLADGRELLRLHRQERVNAHLLDGAVRTPVEAAALVIWSNRIAARQPGLGIWRVDDEHGRFIGIYSLMPLQDDAATEPEVEIGARLLPSAWGRLYALEGGRALCRHAFGSLALPRLLGLCDPDNRPVPALLRRLGFEAAGRRMHLGREALCFELRRADWLRRQGGDHRAAVAADAAGEARG